VTVAVGRSVEGRQLQFQCQPVSVLELPLAPYVGSQLSLAKWSIHSSLCHNSAMLNLLFSILNVDFYVQI